MKLNKSSPLYIVYSNLLKVHTNGHRTWCQTVVNILGEIGYNNIWNNQIQSLTNTEISHLVRKCRSSLQSQYKIYWSDYICDNITRYTGVITSMIILQDILE